LYGNYSLVVVVLFGTSLDVFPLFLPKRKVLAKQNPLTSVLYPWIEVFFGLVEVQESKAVNRNGAENAKVKSIPKKDCGRAH